jgi:hypothetical protein
MLLTVLLAAVLLFFAVIFYALWRKRYVRATLKGPFAGFLVEFEADDRDGDPERHS